MKHASQIFSNAFQFFGDKNALHASFSITNDASFFYNPKPLVIARDPMRKHVQAFHQDNTFQPINNMTVI